MRLILASQSPRRRALIRLLGYPFQAVNADVDESLVTDSDPKVNALRTARLKAVTIANRRQRGAAAEEPFIVAADTIVALDGVMLGKPTNAADARRMLLALRGRSHVVHTGAVLLDLNRGREASGVNTAVVAMRHYSDEEMEAYIASGDPLDKAGAYAIQAQDFSPVAKLDGCFMGVMGLSVCHLLQLFSQLGVAAQADLTAVAAAHQQYACPLFDKIAGNGA